MNYTIKSPDSLKASVKLPASKSICNRALILNALSYSPYEIRNLSDCDDTEVMVKALNSNDRDFDIKAAGTAMRFLTAFLSKVVGEWTITGTDEEPADQDTGGCAECAGSTGGIYGEGGISSSPHFRKCVAGRRDFACRWGQFTVYFGVADDCPPDGERADLAS